MLKFQFSNLIRTRISAAILCVFIFTCNAAYAQKITISGYIRDAASREALIGASVVNANTKSGITSNQYGFFSLTVPVADTIELLVSFTGYTIQAKKISTKQNLRLDIFLEPTTTTLGEVVVSSERNDRNIEKPQMGVIDVPLRTHKKFACIIWRTGRDESYSVAVCFNQGTSEIKKSLPSRKASIYAELLDFYTYVACRVGNHLVSLHLKFISV
jgi:hypothetical protein